MDPTRPEVGERAVGRPRDRRVTWPASGRAICVETLMVLNAALIIGLSGVALAA
jgi:hypothetical protein